MAAKQRKTGETTRSKNRKVSRITNNCHKLIVLLMMEPLSPKTLDIIANLTDTAILVAEKEVADGSHTA